MAGSAVESDLDGPAEPLIGLGYDVTWNGLLASVADERELSCVAEAIDDKDLTDDFLDGAVMGETRLIGAWPIWHRELLGIEVGDDHWPHQVWRCLEPSTAAALYVTVRLEELARADGVSVADSDAGCIMALPADVDLAEAVSESLGTEFSFDNEQDALDLFGELDQVVDPRLLSCMSEVVTVVIELALTELFGDALNEQDRRCVVSALVGVATSGGLDAYTEFLFLTVPIPRLRTELSCSAARPEESSRRCSFRPATPAR